MFGTRRVTSLRLVVSQKSTQDNIAIQSLPFTFMLPSQEENDPMVFTTESTATLALQFDIFHSFSNRIIGRAYFLPQQFALAMLQQHADVGVYGQYQCTTPFFDSHLRVVGEINFEFTVVRPYSHPRMAIDNSGTYWKSTQVCITVLRLYCLSKVASL